MAHVIIIMKDVVIEDIKILLEDNFVQIHPDFTNVINHDNDDDLVCTVMIIFSIIGYGGG